MSSTITREIVRVKDAPAPIGPFSPAVRVNDTVYLSGAIGQDKKGELVAGGIEAQAHQALKNIGEVLEAAGITYGHVVKCTVLLANMADFGKLNDVYKQYFKEKHPARACYQVAALPRGALVEIEAVAVVGEIKDVAHL